MGAILITGSTGFIGQHLVNELSNKEKDLVLLSRNSSNDVISVNLACTSETSKVISNFQIETVVHLASNVRLIRSNLDVDNEINMAINVMSSLRPPCRFIYLSTADEYASNSNLISEDANLKPLNLYAEAKLKARRALEIEATKTGIELVILRPFLVYGPYQPTHMFIPQLLKSIGSNKVFTYSARRKVRDYIHVSDLIKAIEILINYKGNISGIYNVGTGIGTSLSKVVQMVEDKISFKLNSEMDIRLGLDNPDVLIANSEKLKNKTGWHPIIGLSQGLSKLINDDFSF